MNSSINDNEYEILGRVSDRGTLICIVAVWCSLDSLIKAPPLTEEFV
jgi:hypothetical protein